MHDTQPSLSESSLLVVVTLDTLPDGVLNDDLVAVTLRNAGRSPVEVAARLAIGYEDSDAREIYAVVRSRSTGAIVGRRSQLYEREPLAQDQVQVLEPGASVSATFHLHEWYDVPKGELEIQIIYDPCEAAQRFPQIQPKTAASHFVPFVV